MMNDSDSVVPSDTSMNSGNELIVGWKAAPQGNRGKALMGTLSASSNKVIILLLVVSVILLLFGTASVSKENTIKLESEFFTNADRILQHFHMTLHDQLLALDSFSIASTSYALDSSQAWPRVTIPDFTIRAWTARQQMKAETLGLIPLVDGDNRQLWENYAVANHSWIHEARAWEAEKERNSVSNVRYLLAETETEGHAGSARQLSHEVDFSMGIASSIYELDTNGKSIVDEGKGPYAPIWMTSPVPREAKMINYNLLSHNLFWKVIEACIDGSLPALSQVLNLESATPHKTLAGKHPEDVDLPISAIVYPVFDTFEKKHDLVAILVAEVQWIHFFENALPNNVRGIVCVVETACDQQFSIMVEGDEALFLGSGDYHDPQFNHLVQTTRGSEILQMPSDFAGYPMEYEHCPFLLHMYPAGYTRQVEQSSGGWLLLSCGLVGLLVAVVVFVAFYNKTRIHEPQSGVDYGIPATIGGKKAKTRFLRTIPKFKRGPQFKGAVAPPHFKATLRALPERITLSKDKIDPLNNATVMFADIRGLVSWKHNKSDDDATNLIETVNRSLNIIAKRYGIYRVEEIDDSYVAVVGSNGEVNHAALLIRFACDCRKKISEFFKSISTQELSMRFGIHSGYLPSESIVNGRGKGVNLFGETVDMAYQMMTSGKQNRIHISVETAELLNLTGKSYWVSLRSEKVLITGRGEVSTYWVKPKTCLATKETTKAEKVSQSDSSVASDSTFHESDWDQTSISDTLEDKQLLLQSLVDQNVDILLQYLRGIYARRIVLQEFNRQNRIARWEEEPEIGVSILEEAREAIQMPTFDMRLAVNAVNPALVDISPEVESQLRIYVSSIASAYRQTNAFHSFEHASHVVRTIDQMIKKMTSSSDIMAAGFDGKPRSIGEIAKEVDQKTFSIGSDPLVQFTLVFAALVHDVDHVGISNQQLIKESSPIASLYKNRSVSEQNAVDISWWLLMTNDYEDLRSAIYTDTAEMRRFRQCLVNSVIATDILDRNMKDHRDYNWNKCFVRLTHFMDWEEKRNLQATVIAEAVMQAADAGHCLQPFRSYLKWNEKLFEEMYQAYHSGRADVDPSTQWYKAEMAFFDKFLIPLLMRLNDSGVFGGYGQTCLKNAMENRDQWMSQGPALVKDMVDQFSCRVVAAQDDTISFT